MSSGSSPRFIGQSAKLKLLFFGGKGGVGKTTCASAAALALALGEPDGKFLLVSTDPAHSLLGALEGCELPGNLEVRELNAAESLNAFKTKHEAVIQEIAERGTFLDSEDLQSLMDLSMPGMDELAAYLEIADWIGQGAYQTIIVDTAPTGHTLRLLEMPDLVRRWLAGLDTLLAKHRYIRRHFVGDNRLDHLDRFLLGMGEALSVMGKCLVDKSACQFVIVMLAEALSVQETMDLSSALKKKRVSAPEIVVNQMLPPSGCPVCEAKRARQLQAIRPFIIHREKLGFWMIPLYPNEPRGNALASLWWDARELREAECPAPTGQPEWPMRVVDAAPLPSPSSRLLIFSGKGGVGKTTLACAAALRLRRQRPDKRILLFSTDPAHSVADCLGVRLGHQPVAVLPGLDAQEINAEAAFKSIRQDYQEELKAFLTGVLPNMDITFDREVMEHLLDLAPPGLDEIMALTAVMEHLGAGCYDVVIMDAAPSGHLLRLLELPEIIGSWLKQFFALLLKYRQVMRLPKLSQRLVDMSRKLKALKALLADSGQTSLYSVVIPTRLAMEKSVEMVAGLDRLGIRPVALLVNQITPDSGCTLCSALNQRENREIVWANIHLCVGLPHTRIYWHSAAGGLDSLAFLGDKIFQAQDDKMTQIASAALDKNPPSRQRPASHHRKPSQG